MKRKELGLLLAVAVVAGIISLAVNSAIFGGITKRSAQVPVVEPLPRDFPDVKNDPAYKAFLNDQALDPTQPIQIGNPNNPAPFNSSR